MYRRGKLLFELLNISRPANLWFSGSLLVGTHVLCVGVKVLMRSLVLLHSLPILRQKSNEIAVFETIYDLRSWERQTRRADHSLLSSRCGDPCICKGARHCWYEKVYSFFPDENLIAAIKAKT